MTTKKGASNLSRIGCVFRKGKWIDASEEIDKAIAKAYAQGKKDGEANKEIEVIKSRQLGYDEGKANKEDCAKQKQMEAYEEVLKEYKKRDKNIPIMPKYMRDLDFDKFLKQRIKELKGEVSE